MLGIPALYLLLAPAAQLSDVEQADSRKVVQIFHEACEVGALDLKKRKGRVLKKNEITGFMDVLQWGRATVEHQVIEVADPRATYVVFAAYRDVQPRGISRTCAVVSRSLSRLDAAAALRSGVPNVEPKTKWIPNMHMPEWTVDFPEQGFRKRVKFRNDDSILLEVAMYSVSATKPKSEVKR